MPQTMTVRISPETNERLTKLAQRLGANKRTIINQALDALERQLFWNGWDEEATAYLSSYGQLEERERATFAGTNQDGFDQ
jgi:hypothetical protein